MGEIRIVGPGKTRGYPYSVCKKEFAHIFETGQVNWYEKSFERCAI